MTAAPSPPGYVLFSDVHGNLEALEAVLEEAAPLLARGFVPVSLGDLVGMGPCPAETVERVRRIPGVRFVRGNNDRVVGAADDAGLTPEARSAVPPGLVENLRWTRARLAPEGRAFLAAGAPSLDLPLGPYRLLAVHGAPGSDVEPVTPDAVDANLLARFPAHAALLCGHTHRAFASEREGKLVVNAGGCGSALDGDPRAAWATVRLEAGRLVAEIRRTPYDLEATARRLAASDAPWRETIALILQAAGDPLAPPARRR